MEFRELHYFLVVAAEGNISAAAQKLHVAQPSLSRQMKELEQKLGKTLFLRGSRKITLTEEGLILQKRANEMLLLMERTEKEIADVSQSVSGDIYLGSAETNSLQVITDAFSGLRERHPGLRLHVISGDTRDTMEQLENGLLDFALLFSPGDLDRYHQITIGAMDHFGILMRSDSPLAHKKEISVKRDLLDKPLIVSRLSNREILPGVDPSQFLIAGTYNLAFNASILVRSGLGYALCLNSFVNFRSRSNEDLVFVPLAEGESYCPAPNLLWKRHQLLSQPARLLLQELEKALPVL